MSMTWSVNRHLRPSKRVAHLMEPRYGGKASSRCNCVYGDSDNYQFDSRSPRCKLCLARVKAEEDGNEHSRD